MFARRTFIKAAAMAAVAVWVPNEAMRHRILVNNPETLYDFPPSAR